MKNKAHLALLGIAAVAVLIWLMRQKDAASTDQSETSLVPGGNYPNANAEVPFVVNPVAPANLTYNQAREMQLQLHIANRGNAEIVHDTDAPGTGSVVPTPDNATLKASLENFSSFLGKLNAA